MNTNRITLVPTTKAMAEIQPRYHQHLGKNAYLFDGVFNNITYIHVRQLVNEKIPTKDGISLTLSRCNELFMSLPYLDEAVQLMEQGHQTFYRRHLGGNWHVTVQSGVQFTYVLVLLKESSKSKIGK